MFAPNMPEGTGVKQRLRYRFADAGRWPIDVAVYGEVTENQREIELEGKVILQRRLGPFRIAANAWAEREFYFSGAREWVLNPTAGVVLEKWITAQPGIEYWMHGEHADGGGWVIGPEHYLGPTVILQFGKIWWSNGFYFRLNGLTTPADRQRRSLRRGLGPDDRRHQLLSVTVTAPGACSEGRSRGRRRR